MFSSGDMESLESHHAQSPHKCRTSTLKNSDSQPQQPKADLSFHFPSLCTALHAAPLWKGCAWPNPVLDITKALSKKQIHSTIQDFYIRFPKWYLIQYTLVIILCFLSDSLLCISLKHFFCAYHILGSVVDARGAVGTVSHGSGSQGAHSQA